MEPLPPADDEDDLPEADEFDPIDVHHGRFSSGG
jgi:hypothetical protein